MTDSKLDPLAHASATPDIAALIAEFETAQTASLNGLGNITRAEDVRFNRWDGKSSPPDGRLRQKNLPKGELVRPYDGRPDTDVNLADEICNAEADTLLTAVAQARIGATTTHVTPMTAAQSAELRAVGEWIRRVVAQDLADDAELLAQLTTELGWGVANPGWLERWELVVREVELASFIAQLAEAIGPAQAQALQLAILDPTREDQAVAVGQQLLPHLTKTRVAKIVRALRETGKAEFMDRQLAEKRPTIRTLIPGYNYFIAGGAGRLSQARGHLVVERLHQAELEARANAEEWNADFVEAILTTTGLYSAYSTEQKDKAEATDEANDRTIEVWTSYVLQFDEEMEAAGIYCTTFSPHVSPGSETTGAGHYARHYLLDYAHGRAPFVQTRREVIGPSLSDSRGVPEMVQSDQKVIKDLQDASVARAHLEVNPPRAFIGFGGSKIGNWNVPGATIESLMPGGDVKDLGPVRGNPQFAELAINRVEAGTRRRFALPNNMDGSHPSAWQMRQMRLTKRWLGAWEEIFWQLAVLTYQELDPYELAQIIGRWPQVTVNDLLAHRITLTYDARALDADWTQTVLDFVIKLLGIDSGGLMDRGPIIQLALAYIDPTLVQSILRSPEGASAALYRQVEQDISSIVLGNPPQLRENDASAGMQLQMAFAVIGKNQKYQQVISQDQQVQENLKTYLENLQHNEQETQISPMQGRLGVQAAPQRPVQSGVSQPAMIGNGE